MTGLAESNPSSTPDALDDDTFRELHSIWLSRLMLNQFVGWPAETRSFEEFVADMERSCVSGR